MISRNIGGDKCPHCSRSETEAHHPDCPEHEANREKRFEAELDEAADAYYKSDDVADDAKWGEVSGAFFAGARWMKARKS